MTKHGHKNVVWLCAFTYFISYMTRINYGTVIAEMVADTGLSKTALSMALTGCFITYGVGQILSGFLGDAFQPKHMVATGLAVTTAMNLCIPLCHSLFYNRYATLNVVLSAVLTGCMHEVNYMLICILPPLLAKQGRVSTMLGLLNACTYIGSALATYAIPFAAERAGWHASLILWLAVALGGMVLCFLCVPLWKTHKVES